MIIEFMMWYLDKKRYIVTKKPRTMKDVEKNIEETMMEGV